MKSRKERELRYRGTEEELDSDEDINLERE